MIAEYWETFWYVLTVLGAVVLAAAYVLSMFILLDAYSRTGRVFGWIMLGGIVLAILFGVPVLVVLL